MLKIILLLLISINLHSGSIPSIITSNQFYIKNKVVKFDKFIIISLNSKGLGILYFIDHGRTVIKTKISGGAPDKSTPYGLFNVLSKKKFHMSNLYPDPSGVNNMDDMLRLTNDGIAIHKGSIKYLSHGCIHVDESYSRKLFDISTKNLSVIITNEEYEDFLD